MEDKYMFDLADKYRELREKKADLDAEVKALNQEIAGIEQELIQVMTDNECEGFKRNGKNFIMVTKNYPAAIPERKEYLYDQMIEHGYEHIFTINTNTLQSTVRELKENNNDELPDWLEGLIKETERVSIQLRKA